MAIKKIDCLFFDSNVFINQLRFPEYEQKLERFWQGSLLYTINKIVLMELWAGARDKIEENILLQYERTIPLVGISDDCFMTAGQLMKRMREASSIEPKTRRRLTWDILIALSAKENGALLVTENEADFNYIRKFMEFEFIVVGHG